MIKHKIFITIAVKLKNFIFLYNKKKSQIFRYKLLFLKFKNELFNKPQQYSYDIVFISPESGWILDGICKEIDRYFSGKTTFCYSIENLPSSRAYFFAHYSLFASAIFSNPQILISTNLIWYTHPRDIGLSNNELANVLNQSTKILATNSKNEDLLLSLGVQSKKVMTLLGGADESFFTPKPPRSDKVPCIGFCLGFRNHQHYRERKNYDLIVNLITQIQNANVLILGKNWHEYECFDKLAQLSYFRYVEVPYSQYPQYYHQMDVFVSASKLEGGPIPLIEAMMCNVFPVVSNTGFAPDIIEHGQNGFLFDVESSPEYIYTLIEKAISMNVDVRKTVEHLSWKNFSLAIQKLLV
ncbi:glycosyltransferase family 4 protein [Calothrix sp. FACHB-156]|nr:glycosyltransferase family 4 protein [Calothrix sp. FACHB-156]